MKFKRFKRFIPRLRLSNVFLLVACFAILFAWYRDRLALIAEYEARMNPAISWSDHQVLGPPDTPGAGDIGSAWASSTQDGQREWLIVTYNNSVVPSAIEIHETYNPGAVDKIAGIDAFGIETVLWQGIDPAPAGAARSTSLFPVTSKKKFRKFKVYIDSPTFPGWNEIDAIGVRSKLRGTQWASGVESSSSYGARYTRPMTLSTPIVDLIR